MQWLKVRAGGVAACALAAFCGARAAEPAAATVPPAGAAPAAGAPAAGEPPPPGTPARGRLARWFNPATAPFIPIPEIDTEPHSGLTLGVIPTWLRTNERGQIERIIAPDIIRSQYFGWGSRMRVFGYPSSDTQWSVVGGLKERVEREFDAQYLTGQTRRSALSWSVEAVYDRSGTPRFFGLGNETPHTQETSYVDNQGRIDVALALNITPVLQLSYNQRWRDVEVLPATLRGLPSIGTVFPALKGLGTEHELEQSAMLICDTRDSPIVPHRGARYIVYDGFVSRAFGSSVSYSYLGAEARHYSALSAAA